MAAENRGWPIRLYNKSVLKQNKYKAIVSLLGDTRGLRCLDIGADNGVVSYLLRQRGGEWTSADLDSAAVASIRNLVGERVYQLDGERTGFPDQAFDVVVIVDYLEHIPGDRQFVDEVWRILRPGGTLIVNVPHDKPGLLRSLRHALGLTEEQHGHLRPGYRLDALASLLEERFTVEVATTYSKSFSELADILVNAGVSLTKRGRSQPSHKGLLVTGDDMRRNRRQFALYSAVYPLMWALSRLDAALFFASGYMLLVRARARDTGAPRDQDRSGQTADSLGITLSTAVEG